MLSAAIWPLLRNYASHVQSPVPEAELRAQLKRRLSFFPLWARLYLAGSALFVRFFAPCMTLGRAGAFDGLSEADREECLTRLQRDGRFLVRPMFLGIKSLLLACCYGAPQFLSTIGYEPRRSKANV